MKEVTATPKLYIGFDIHKRSWKVQCNTDLFSGKTFTMPPGSDQLKKYVDKHYPDHEVSICYEAGCCGYSWHRDFESFGWRSLVVNPGDIPKPANHRFKKTDKIDARQLSRELKDERLSGIFVPDKLQQDLRSLFRRRIHLVKDFRRIKCHIKSQLLFEGVEIPEDMDTAKWTYRFRNWIKALEFENQTLQHSNNSRMRQYDFIDQELRTVSNQLRAYCRKHYNKDYNLLRSLPGIGGIVASGILGELGDLRRFNFNQLSGYVGLVPSIQQSGEKLKMQTTTKRAHHIMRSYFIEAAWIAVRFDPAMQAYYRKHAGKDSKRIIFKVAHKLLSRTLAVIKTEIPYQIGIVK